MNGFVWSYLVHFGVNSWKDVPLETQDPSSSEHSLTRCCADRIRFDEASWRRISAKLAGSGCNQIVIDLAEILRYPSHPELGVEGSWSVERMRTEIARLRGMGFEVIPKMNFSTGHDTWLKEYHMMVSTPEYYRVCEDLITEVCEIFDHPRFFHLGYDEETFDQQVPNRIAIVRQGELWWHDFLWFVKVVEKRGARPWIWSDRAWHHKDEFLKRMPKSVLQSNWYYGNDFNPDSGKGKSYCLKFYDIFAENGFDQIPTGSNYRFDSNFGNLVRYCDSHVTSGLKGYMMASWARTFAIHEAQALRAVDDMAATIKSRKS